MNIAQGYKKQGAAKLGCVIWLLKCSAVLEEVWKTQSVKIVPLICYSILKILVDCDNKSLHTFPVVVLTITFQGNKPFYMPLVCILSQPFRKSKESEKLNDAKKSREDWGSPIFAPVSLRFFPAFYFSPAFHNLNAYDKVVFFRKKEMAKQLCCSIFCLLTFFFFALFLSVVWKVD